MHKLQKIIAYLFNILFFVVPLIVWPFTSELFEFNKIVVTYMATALIVGVWAARMISEKKIIFRRTLLDTPLLIFVGSQLLSTIFSMDIHTSIFGYYSRFNGGLLSVICYALLYWGFVANMNHKTTIKSIYALLSSAAIVSVYGILQHLGIDKNIWVQDVVNRVFSSLGQPNWLAAFLAALIPITFSGLIKKPYSYILSILFFITLLFTKSRSGIIGFFVADLIFWGYLFLNHKKKYLKEFLIFSSIFLVLFFVIKTPFTSQQTAPINTPALEVGGTESGSIRKIVWKGALTLWKQNPIFGTGPETFAYAYFGVRPIEHNLVSEWDFIYNKAHNEYLNFAANSGTLGLLSYLALIGFTILLFVRLLKKDKNELVTVSLLTGYISLLVSNFFGFSVVPTQLQLFLFPAIAMVMNQEEEKKSNTKFSYWIIIPLIIALLVLFGISKYWKADTLYATARSWNRSDNPIKAIDPAKEAISISPNEPVYHLELAEGYTKTALALYEADQKESVEGYAENAVTELLKAQELSPNNVNIKRIIFSSLVRLSLTNPRYLIDALEVITQATLEAPTDAKLFYNLGLTYARVGQVDPALENIKRAVELKPNYKEARLALAFLLIDRKENILAREQLEYILVNIDPNDTITKSQLEELK